MKEQANAYINYIKNMHGVTKPAMPKFDVIAYTENEYVRAIDAIDKDFLFTDSMDLTIDYLKGE